MGILRYKTDWVSLYFEGKFKKVCVTVLFLPCFILYLGAISKYKSLGAYIRRGNLTEGFLHYDFGGLIHGGAHFRDFTVYTKLLFTLTTIASKQTKKVLPNPLLTERACLQGTIVEAPLTNASLVTERHFL